MLVSASSISSGDKDGHILGTLVFGRYMYEDDIRTLAEKTSLPVEVYRFNEIPEDIKYQALQSKEPDITLKILNSDLIAGYAVINDVYGKPALLVRVEMPKKHL